MRPATPHLVHRRFRPRRRARVRQRQAGFTLIELMIVIVIVGISAAMVAPSVMTSMASSRTSRCQYDSARLLRSARSESIATGRALLVDFDNGGGSMQLRLYRGDSSSCSRATWGGIVGVDTPLDQVRAIDYSLAGHTVVISVTTAGAASPQQLCFEPDGDRFERTSRTGVFVRQPGLTTVAFDRTTPTGVTGDVQRRIVIPQFGAPRVTR